MALISEALDGVGFDEAQPGEFTKRAFINEKLGLNEAEAVLDVIDSTNANDVLLSSRSLSGDFSKKIKSLSKNIDNLRMRVEGEIDFSDEGESFMDQGVVEDLKGLISEFDMFVSGCKSKKSLSVKNKVVFVGPVNSGKSSTFNRLLGYERALISDKPGTTRDIIESEVFYESVSFSLFDTAGLRETNDSIEAKGIDYTKNEITNADVVVGVFDSSTVNLVNEFESIVGNKPFLKILNKIDLDYKDGEGFDCKISAKTGEGFEEFKKKITGYFQKRDEKNGTFLVRDRHINLFESASFSIRKALMVIQKEEGLEIAAEELKMARECLDVVVGKKTSDQLLGDIFSNFCIGK
jgi:tRNA modification GTPase